MTRLSLMTLAGALCLFWFVPAARGQAAAGTTVILDMGASHGFKPSDIEDPKTKQKVPCGTLEAVEGRDGAAVRFSFRDDALGGYMARWIVADEGWDKAAGLSFWLKGDGSDSWGGLELIDGDTYTQRYAFCFPIDSTEWRKVVVPWRELVPILSSPLLAPERAGGFRPSGFRNLWFGKRGYWRDAPACSFAIDEIALESTIATDASDDPPVKPGLARLLAKLKEGRPVTVVTMGDSLTDKKHWANRDKDWNEELVRRLEAQYGSKVTLINPAIGGTTLSQNLILMPRWLKQAPQPDLVTVWFGYNDWDTMVRRGRYKEYLNLAVDRIRRLTGGSADILLMATCPAFERWETMGELCQAACEVARERDVGFADVASAFHKAPSAGEALKLGYWAWDKTHLDAAGHDIVAATVMAAVASAGQGDLQAAADAYWARTEPEVGVPEGQTLLSSFEPGQASCVANAGGTVVKEHATGGTHALKLASQEKDYVSISIEDGTSLGLARQSSRILVDVFNPQAEEVNVNVMVKDPQSKDYPNRYNGTVIVRPGQSTLDVDYTRLMRTGTAKTEKPDYIDPRQITLVVLFLDPHGTQRPVVLFVDNVRLAAAPATAGR